MKEDRAPRTLAEIDADLARLDGRLMAYDGLDDAPEDLQNELARLSMERCRVLNAQSADDKGRPQKAA